MAKRDSINLSIFSVLKVSEMSKIPVLLMGCPGVGKTKSVEMFAEVRGYNLILLRGNSTSAEVVNGYDVAPPDANLLSTKHLRPSWFQKLKECEAKGEKTLLFLDEITTANEYVQAALLHLIFERTVDTEKIPDDCLIVSAGNYAQNLSNQMSMLPPLMNRFLIFNIIPEVDDLDIFLNKFDGAILDYKKNYMNDVVEKMKEIDSQELNLPSEIVDKVGDYIERTIRLTARQLMSGSNKKHDPKIQDLQNLYSDLKDDAKLPGFITFRTLNYYRDVAIASYLCFGKAGLVSDSFKLMTLGLVGLGITRDSSGDVKFTDTTDDFFKSMGKVVNEIEKMNNSTLPIYEAFFKKMTLDKKSYQVEDMNLIINKIKELNKDKTLTGIKRPIDSSIMKKMCDIMKSSASNYKNLKVDRNKKPLDQFPIDKFNGMVSYWSYLADLTTEVYNFINKEDYEYEEITVNTVKDTREDLRRSSLKLLAVRRILVIDKPELSKILPEINNLQ